MALATVLAAAATPIAAPASSVPVVPSWVKPKLVLHYADDLGGKVAYDYNDTVTSVADGVVSVSTYQWSPGVPGTAKTTAWSCPAVCTGLAASLSAQFWIDPADPAASLLSGSTWSYRYMGIVSFTYDGRTYHVGELYHPTAEGPEVTYFQPGTGLFLYHKEWDYDPYSLSHWYANQLYYLGNWAASLRAIAQHHLGGRVQVAPGE